MEITNWNIYSKIEKFYGLDSDKDVKSTLRSHLGAFILSNSKQIVHNFIGEVNGIYNNSIYYGEMDSMYIESNFWDVLDKAGLVGSNLCQGKNNYKPGGIFYGRFPGPKLKYRLTIDKIGIVQEQKT